MSYPRAYSQSKVYSRSNSITSLNSTAVPLPSPTATSPQYDSPPLSNSMIRKRTLQEMSTPQSPFTFDNAQSSSSSSPMSSLPSFEFDTVNQIGTSSPFSTATLDSSPMVLSRSTSSDSSYDSNKVKADSDEEETPSTLSKAPEMKRRRTIDTDLLTPLKIDRRGNGKDGQDVWPADVETAFHDALGIIPKLGRKKVMVNGKPCGRNELIADYIRRKTGKSRSRKQVSSHIQVLKNMRKHDAIFMALVAEPAEGEDSFAPDAALAFFGKNLPTITSEPMTSSYSDAGLLSPYTPSTYIPQQRSLSCGSLSPTQYDRSNTHSPIALSRPMSATSSITTAMKEMHFPIPSPRSRTPVPCPIAPAAFKIWADDSQSTSASHVFARLDNASLAGPSDTVFLDNLPTPEKRFPGLVAMSDHLPCQFLHVKINLDIPDARSPDFAPEKLKTQLILTSLQNLNLTSVTSIYSCGVQVLSLEEQLSSPNKLNSSTTSAESSPDSPCSPMTPTDSSSPTNPLKHKYSYSAPFASAFWSVFLAGSFSRAADELPHRGTFIKTGDERPEIALAVSGLTIIQEFVVRPEEQSVPLVDGINISPGSALGDVVLVITYDFECQESNTMGTASVSHLSVRRSPARVIRMQSGFLSTNRSAPVHTFPSNYSVTNSNPEILSPRPTHSAKPSLTLHIPPPPTFSSSSTGSTTPYGSTSSSTSTLTGGPITPWPQVMNSTPTMPPPPSVTSTSPSQRDRLEQIWARDSNEWEMNSPALMGAFSHQQSSHSQPQQQQHHHPHQYHHHYQSQQHHQSVSHSQSHHHSHRQLSHSPPRMSHSASSSSSHHQSHQNLHQQQVHQHHQGTPYIHPAHNLDGMLPYIKPEEVETRFGSGVDDRGYFSSAPISRYSSQYSN